MSKLIQWRTKSPEDLINRVKSNLDSIKMHFFEIGGYLYEAYSRGFYHGYANILDFSAENFGFQKTLTYDLINVFRHFRDGDSFLPIQSVAHLNQTQLVELCRCQAGRENLAAIISPSDTVKDVKRAVKLFNGLSMNKRTSFEATNLRDFISQIDGSAPPRSAEETKGEAQYYSAQTESAPIRSLREIFKDHMDVESFAQKLSNVISDYKECVAEFKVGSSYRNDLIEIEQKLLALFDRFYNSDV